MTEFHDLDGEKFIVRAIRNEQVFNLSSPKPTIEECRAIVKGAMNNALRTNQHKHYMICKINYEEIERI